MVRHQFLGQSNCHDIRPSVETNQERANDGSEVTTEPLDWSHKSCNTLFFKFKGEGPLFSFISPSPSTSRNYGSITFAAATPTFRKSFQVNCFRSASAVFVETKGGSGSLVRLRMTMLSFLVLRSISCYCLTYHVLLEELVERLQRNFSITLSRLA